MLRAIREIQPAWVVGENVSGLVSWNGGMVFDEVQADLEAAGYEVIPFILPACAVNAPHRRDRVWFVAKRNVNDTNCTGLQKERAEQQTTGAEQYGKLGIKDVAHPNRNGFNGSNGKHEINTSEGGEYALSNIEQMGGDVANTNNELLQRRGGKNRPEKAIGHTSASFCRNTWENFPTQSPICGGDDGLPTDLDGIAFSKWRNESIKAFGNAIVPQVALQIFKSIQEYETLLQK